MNKWRERMMKWSVGIVLITMLSPLSGLVFARAGDILSRSDISVGYGYVSTGWRTNETASANSPATAPNPETRFTVGDFTFTIWVGGTFLGSAGVTFNDRVLGAGAHCCQSPSVDVELRVQYTGDNPQYDNLFHFNVDQISIYAFKHTSWAGGSSNKMWWVETTHGNASASAVVETGVGTGYTDPANYTQVSWNPPDTPHPGVLSMRRTFQLQPKDAMFSVDGFEIVCSAQVESVPVEVEGVSVATTNFSVGYGYISGWKTNETASANTPPTAPSQGNSFTMGDFTFKIDVARNPFSSAGPRFSNRVLSNGDGGGSAGSFSGDGADVTVTALYTGAATNSQTSFRLTIEQVAVHAFKWSGGLGGATNTAYWIETTPGYASTSSVVVATPVQAGGSSEVRHFAQVGYNPPDISLAGTNGMTRTLTLPGDLLFAVDGFEIVGSAQILGPPAPPAGTIILIR